MAKKFQTLNIGASTVALAEYEASGSKLTLVNYGTAQLDMPLDAGDVDAILSPKILEIVREKGIKPGKVALSVSGQMVFTRFAAIPYAGKDETKFEGFVRAEIEQNTPFQGDEMVFDRQVLGDTENGDKSVMIVAAKVEQIEAITTALQKIGFQPTIVDVAPFAVTNALKANRGDEGCVVLLDVGAKTTSLVITEGEKMYIRSIPVAGNTITKEIAQTLGCTQEEADQFKRENAYVSMGGVTEDEDATREAIAKVCRAVMTRLHAEISRSINFYRSQQGGGMPVKLYLTGGSSLLAQMDAFFQDSLQIEVEYFNPFEVIEAASGLDAEALSTDAAFLSATAGLALHAAGQAELKINLIPQSILDARAEVARIPFVAVGAVGLIACCVCLWLAAANRLGEAERDLEIAQRESQRLAGLEKKIKTAQTDEAAAKAAADELLPVLAGRSTAVDRFNAVRASLGPDLWIQSWQGDKATHLAKIVIRGWKDRLADFVANAPECAEGKRLTAAEIVVSRLKGTGLGEEALAKWAIDPATVKVTDSRSFGKDDCVVQFEVELAFK